MKAKELEKIEKKETKKDEVIVEKPKHGTITLEDGKLTQINQTMPPPTTSVAKVPTNQTEMMLTPTKTN
jgi:hypothetical protein